MTDLISHSASKGNERWPDVLENMELLEDKEWKTTPPDKTPYAQIMVTEIKGTDDIAIQKQEQIVRDCATELEVEENYYNKLQQKLTGKVLF